MKIKGFELKRKKDLTIEEKKQRAKIELVIFLVIIAFVFAYAKIIVATNNNSQKEQYFNKVSLTSLKETNFTLEIQIDDNNYKYEGNTTKNDGNISINNTNYYIVNNEYYDEDFNKQDIFKGVDNKYFSYENIEKFIDKGKQEGSKYTYSVKDVVNKVPIDTTITVKPKYYKDNIKIELNYTNLVNVNNTKIKSYIATYTIKYNK